MNILMVGHSGAGKTSYMAGLYKQFGGETNGFGLWMSDSNKRDNLIHLAHGIERGYYPNGTDIASQYQFYLQFDNELLIPFNWYDYRGGALSESSKYSPDAQELLRRMNSADALIVFLDGAKITKMTDDDLEEEYDILLWAIQNTISKRSSDGTYFPISFIITKGDLYPYYDVLLNSPGLNYFMPLIKNISESKNAAGMIGIVEVSKIGISNVFSPLIFSLYYGMHHYIRARIECMNAEIEKYNSYDPGLIDDFFVGLDHLFGGDSKTDRQLAAESLERIQEEKQKLENLEALSSGMEEILNKFVEHNMIIKF